MYFCALIMIPQWQKGIVTSVEQATPNTRRYRIEMPEVSSFPFKPGQFVTLDLPISEQRNKRWRSYSIASAPDNSNVIELVIAHLLNGVGSNYIFTEVHEGSVLTLRGPQGVFTLPEQLDKELFLICTGTGIAPFRSMVNYIKEHNIPHNHIHLIFGTRRQEDLLYAAELRALEQSMPHFHYYITLSREDWGGHKGYVHKIYEELCKDKPEAQFMVCGWRPMIDEAKERLQQMGYGSKSIHVELYG